MTNPSGKTSDTFAKDLTKTAVFNNTDGTAAGNASSVGTNGKFTYDNADDLTASYMGFSGDKVTVTPTFVNYVEGIYVGYKFYETAAGRRPDQLRRHRRVPVRLRPVLHVVRAGARQA